MRDGAVVGAVLSAALVAASYLGWRLGALPFVPFDLFDWIVRELPGSIVTIGIDSAVTVLRALHVASTAAAAKTAEQTLAIAAFLASGVVAGSVLFGVLGQTAEPAFVLGAIVGTLLGASVLLVEHGLRRISSPAFVDTSWILGLFVVSGATFGWIKTVCSKGMPNRPVHASRRLGVRTAVDS